MGIVVMLAGEHHPLALVRSGTGYALDGIGQVEPDGEAVVAADRNSIWIHLGGRAYELGWQDPVTFYGEEGSADDGSVSRASMPGAVVSVSVAAGDAVATGDALLVIESMKLESVIRASRAGVVATVHVSVGQTFERDAVLVSLQEESA
jgi:3-methylcrotonyl-CoA carboxylase alpha subunit